jgi:hypothetical protein
MRIENVDREPAVGVDPLTRPSGNRIAESALAVTAV